MATPKRPAKSVVDEMRESFRREQKVEADIFESTMRGFVIPLIEAGLVDDVEPTPGTVGARQRR